MKISFSLSSISAFILLQHQALITDKSEQQERLERTCKHNQTALSRFLPCCSGCKTAFYCSRDFQRKDWGAGHKGVAPHPVDSKSPKKPAIPILLTVHVFLVHGLVGITDDTKRTKQL
jgi:hypothetical protein